MDDGTIDVYDMEEAYIASFHITEDELHFIYDYLDLKGATYYRPSLNKISIDTEQFKKDMFIDTMPAVSNESSFVKSKLSIGNNYQILKDIIKAIEPYGNGDYLFKFTIL